MSGYSFRGQVHTTSTTVDKFPFASDGNATDVGDLLQLQDQGAGQSSTVAVIHQAVMGALSEM